MPKSKAFLKQGKTKKRKDEPTLDTADDYQAAGVEFEEAAGKHRAGDAVKSFRFFERAISTYEEGLGKFPTSFDLAYNKARVQYEVAIHPKLAQQLQKPLVDVLRVALASHEYALKLNETDADLLFNTSQVLTSIAEELANSGFAEEAIRLLQSALGLQARCFSVQEQRYAETLEQERETRELFESAANNDVSPHDVLNNEQSSDTSSTMDEGQWASVVEPVTADTLTDTILACFATMTTLSTTITTSGNQAQVAVLADLESQSKQLREKAQVLPLSDTKTIYEFALADAILSSALLDAAFTFRSLAAATYKDHLDRLWSAPHLDSETHPDIHIAHANASIAFNFSLSNTPASNTDLELTNLRWMSLTSAITSLTKSSKLPSILSEEKVNTHLLRGDASLLQYRLSEPPNMHKQAAVNAEQLLKNAQVFYRNAVQLSSDQEAKEHAVFRCTIAKNIGQRIAATDVSALGSIFSKDQERRAREELQDMIDEGLLLERIDPTGLSVYM